MAKQTIPTQNDMLELVYNYLDKFYESTNVRCIELETGLRKALDEKVQEVNDSEFAAKVALCKKLARIYKDDKKGKEYLDAERACIEYMQSKYFNTIKEIFKQNGEA